MANSLYPASEHCLALFLCLVDELWICTMRKWLEDPCVFLLILMTSLHVTRFPRRSLHLHICIPNTGGDKVLWTKAKLCTPGVNYAQRYPWNAYLLHLCVLFTCLLNSTWYALKPCIKLGIRMRIMCLTPNTWKVQSDEMAMVEVQSRRRCAARPPIPSMGQRAK